MARQCSRCVDKTVAIRPFVGLLLVLVHRDSQVFHRIVDRFFRNGNAGVLGCLQRMDLNRGR